MDKLKLAFKLIVAFLFLAMISCRSHEKGGNMVQIQKEPALLEATIGGMFCTDCELTIQKRVGDLAGIKSVKASYVAGNALIQYFPDKVDSVKIREAITGSGYTVKKFSIPSK